MVAEFTAAEAAIAPVMDMAAISADPHVEASGMIVEVEGVPMQGLVGALATPGRGLRWIRRRDADGGAGRRAGRLGLPAGRPARQCHLPRSEAGRRRHARRDSP